MPEPANRLSPSAEAASSAEPTSEPTPAGPTATPSFVRPTPTPAPPFATYKVKRGDTLTAIAKRFDTTLLSIAYWNRVTYPTLDPDSTRYRPDRLEVGWVLQILKGEVVDPEALPTLTPGPTEAP